MTRFDKKDIPALDFIINKCLKNELQSVIANDLIKNGFLTKVKGYSSLLYLDEYKEFERLMFIIRQYNCAKTRFVSEKEANLVSNVSKNIETSQFKSQGGFKKAYKELKTPINWYKIIPIIIAIIFGSLNVYQKYNYNSLKVDFQKLKSELASLKGNLPDKEYKRNLNKGKPLLDTLRTKKVND